MKNVSSIVAAIFLGVILAVGAGWATVASFDQDRSPQVQNKVKTGVNPLDRPETAYGNHE